MPRLPVWIRPVSLRKQVQEPNLSSGPRDLPTRDFSTTIPSCPITTIRLNIEQRQRAPRATRSPCCGRPEGHRYRAAQKTAPGARFRGALAAPRPDRPRPRRIGRGPPGQKPVSDQEYAGGFRPAAGHLRFHAGSDLHRHHSDPPGPLRHPPGAPHPPHYRSDVELGGEVAERLAPDVLRTRQHSETPRSGTVDHFRSTSGFSTVDLLLP